MKENIILKIEKTGYYYPFKALDDHDVQAFKKEYYKLIKKIKSPSMEFEYKFKSHLLFKWVNNLIRNENILEIAREYLGKNILCWNSIFFHKKKKSKNFVGWHEDKTYWNLANDKILSFSLAITNSNVENGCLKILKNRRKVNYEDKDIKNNMLARGQNAIIDKNEEFEYIKLNPGECSIFKQDIIHGSDPNLSNEDRILLVIRYISPDNNTFGNHRSATLVSGKDDFNFYEKEPIPRYDFDEECVKFHQELMKKQATIFAKHKLKKIKLPFLSNIASHKLARGIYYKYFK